jgi:hypothetical protein
VLHVAHVSSFYEPAIWQSTNAIVHCSIAATLTNQWRITIVDLKDVYAIVNGSRILSQYDFVDKRENSTCVTGKKQR